MLTGLLLGAGASYECGMPLVNEVSESIRASLTPDHMRARNERSRRFQTDVPAHCLEYLISLLARRDMTYESVIGNLEIMSRRHQERANLQAYHGLRLDLIQVVSLILFERHRRLKQLLPSQMRFLDGILGLARDNQPLWILSLNHDLFIECLAAHHGIPLNTGHTEPFNLPLPAATELRPSYINGKVLTKDQTQRGIPYPQRGFGINLLKPHGSLDEFVIKDDADTLKIEPIKPTAAGVIDALTLVNEVLPHRFPLAPDFGITNGIVYMDDQGAIQFLGRSILAGPFKFKADQPFGGKYDMLSHFRGGLNYLSKIICIGYGFGDLHINWAVRNWLEFSVDRTLEIVDPHRSNVPLDLLHVAPQVTLHSMGAFEFLEQFSPQPLSPLERATRDALARARGAAAKLKAAGLSDPSVANKA